MHQADLQLLSELTVARERHSELADLLAFYHDLYQVQFEAKAGLPPLVARDDLAARWRLEGGIPQLTFNQLGIESQAFARLVADILQVLVRHEPAWAASPIDPAAHDLVGLARQVFETWYTLTPPEARLTDEPGSEPAPDYRAAQVVALALAPYLQLAAEVLLTQLDLSLWNRGTCPVCGGGANLALLEQNKGARQLVCSRCNGQWNFRRTGCPFCGSGDKQNYYPSQDGAHRLYVCPQCNRYLKTVDQREIHRPVYPQIERLLTVGMDLAAQQQGYVG